MALAFATVVSTFTAWLMSLIPGARRGVRRRHPERVRSSTRCSRSCVSPRSSTSRSCRPTPRPRSGSSPPRSPATRPTSRCSPRSATCSRRTRAVPRLRGPRLDRLSRGAAAPGDAASRRCRRPRRSRGPARHWSGRAARRRRPGPGDGGAPRRSPASLDLSRSRLLAHRADAPAVSDVQPGRVEALVARRPAGRGGEVVGRDPQRPGQRLGTGAGDLGHPRAQERQPAPSDRVGVALHVVRPQHRLGARRCRPRSAR